MRRIYFLVPSVASAKAIVDELLLARIEERRIHIVAREGTPLEDLPEAGVVQRSDLVPALEKGVAAGGLSGLLAGALAVSFPPAGQVIGGFQAENALMAAGLCIVTGADPAETFDALHSLQTVRGRMQFAPRRDNGATVFVDYAHTPEALRTALKAVRPHVFGRLVVVFGAGGDRDRGKRPLMGRAAADKHWPERSFESHA